MKRFLAVSLLLLTFTPAQAQNMAPITPMMKKFDTNHDGMLDPAERQAMWKALQQKNPTLFKRFDQNGDGQITGNEEIEAFRLIQRKHAADSAPAHASKSPKSHLPSASSDPTHNAPEGSNDPPLDK